MYKHLLLKLTVIAGCTQKLADNPTGSVVYLFLCISNIAVLLLKGKFIWLTDFCTYIDFCNSVCHCPEYVILIYTASAVKYERHVTCSFKERCYMFYIKTSLRLFEVFCTGCYSTMETSCSNQLHPDSFANLAASSGLVKPFLVVKSSS